MAKIGDAITQDTLSSLIARRLIAIVLDDVVGPEECDQIAQRIRPLTQARQRGWSHQVTMLGTSIGEAHLSAEAEAKYFDEVPATIEFYRRAVFVNGSPLRDVVRQLAAAWPPGVYVPCRNGRGFLPEVIRHWRNGAHAHIDRSRTPLLQPLRMNGRLGVNVFIQMPTAGGAVEIWDRQFTEDECLQLIRKGHGIDRTRLGDPDVRLRPKKGQAIVFRASDPHAIEGVAGEGDRITCSTFFGIPFESQPAPVFA